MLIGKNKLIARRASADTIELSFNSRCGPRGGIPDTRCGIIFRSPFGAGCATFIVVGHGSRYPSSCSGCWTAHSKLSEPKINQLLTKLVYLEIGHWGRVCWLSGQPLA